MSKVTISSEKAADSNKNMKIIKRAVRLTPLPTSARETGTNSSTRKFFVERLTTPSNAKIVAQFAASNTAPTVIRNPSIKPPIKIGIVNTTLSNAARREITSSAPKVTSSSAVSVIKRGITPSAPSATNEQTSTSTVVAVVKKEVKQLEKIEMEQKPSPVYEQRKCMLNEFKELFGVLMRFPDKEIQQKVLRCLNAKYANKETQTDPVEILETSTSAHLVNAMKAESTPTSPNNSRPPTPKKRKRRRKVALPQASKESRVAQRTLLAKMNVKQKPQLQQLPQIEDNSTQQMLNGGSPAKRARLDSETSISSSINNMFDDILVTMREEKLYQNIIKDCLMADIPLENGLLPIYDCIVKDKYATLKIQIFIWKEYKHVDLNELITEDDEDLLQLAINNNCSPQIINLLLTNGLNTNSVDSQGNTVIHLSVLNDIDPDAMEHLLSHIDLKTLLELNDDGYTSLQLAVRQDYFLLAESILNAMDKRLSGRVFYIRDKDKIETNENAIKLHFKTYYEKVCREMTIEDDGGVNYENIIRNHDLKQKLLQVPDMRSGCTALFFAIENQSEHLIYFLLAHLSDPRTENLSGQDCKTFFSEYGRSLNLSLDIDTAMEKVIKILS
ncbi:charon [Musca autumnalis]|uniref:charon n=1 Tax=Musca autumnalis TaxID=221902 RepID=UPI003CF1FC65